MSDPEIIEAKGVDVAKKPASSSIPAHDHWECWYVSRRDKRWIWERDFPSEAPAAAWAESCVPDARIFHISLPEVTA